MPSVLETETVITYFSGTTTPDFISFAAANTLFSVKRFNRPIYPFNIISDPSSPPLYNTTNVRNHQSPRTMP